MLQKYDHVKDTYFKLLNREIKGEDVKYDLEELYKYIIDNNLNIDKIHKELVTKINYGFKYDFSKNKNTLTFIIDDMTVKFLEYAPNRAVNPHYPLIKIISKNKRCHFFQIIHLNFNISKWFEKEQVLTSHSFLDTTIPKQKYHPYYSNNNIFIDTPIWTKVNFLMKKDIFWIAHCYAIDVNRNTKEITYLGGVN